MYDSDDDEPGLIERFRKSLYAAFVRVLSFFGSIANWFERLFQRPFRQSMDEDIDETSSKPSGFLGRFLSSVKKLPSKILAASDATERSLRKAGQMSGELGDRINQADSGVFQGLRKIASPFLFAGNSLLRFANRIYSRIRNVPVINKLFPVLRRTAYPLVATSIFLSSIFRSRSLASRIWTAAIAGTLILGLGGFWFLGPRSRNIPKAYRTAFEKAIKDGDFANAQLYQQKLLSLGVGTSKSQLQSIIDLANSGKMEEAIKLAEELAPVDGFGSPEAHFWLAQTYFAERDPRKTKAENLDLIDQHLKKLTDFFQADQRLKMPPNISFLKALVHLKKNNLDEGLRVLDSLSDYWPAVVYLVEANSLVDSDEATRHSRILCEMARADQKILNELNEPFFPVWCRALLAEGESADLNDVLSWWHRRFPENSVARIDWSQLQLRQLETMVENGASSRLPEASKLLVEIGARLGNEHYEILSDWVMRRLPPFGNNPRYLELAGIVENESGLTSELAELLGSSAILRKDAPKGVELLKRSTSLNENNAIAWNNLAYALYLHPEQDSSLSPIELVEKAIRLSPDRTSFRHTRGMIHLKMENWSPAIEDLKLVLRDEPNKTDVHSAIATAYRAIGNPEMAIFHEEIIKN